MTNMKMKYLKYTIGLVSILLVSCSIQETDVTTPKNTEEPVFYASIEGSSTRVFVDEDLNVLWNAEDQVSIFNKNTYNQPYKFLGNTGDNAGGFNKVDVAEFVTGKPITNIVSVYPYQEGTQISESGVLTVTLPKEQTYSEKTFGMGTNTMVSVSTDNYLQYKNVGGYLKLRLYGEGVSISTIILKGNNNEKLSGKAYVTMPLDGTPSVEMSSDAETEVILSSKNSVLLGSTAENCTDFWFVLPPVTFSKGFTIIVKRKDGQAFTKTASSPVTITRNNLLNMAPFEVKMEGTQPNNVIYYTTSDSTILSVPYLSSYVLSNDYIDGIGIMTLRSSATSIGIKKKCFMDCTNLTSISLPNSVTSIGDYAFYGCTSLASVKMPYSLTDIGISAFYGCKELTTVEFPTCLNGSIGERAFYGCSKIKNIAFPETMSGSISDEAFMYCSKLSGSLTIPEGTSSIGLSAFSGCSSLESIILPKTMDGSIGVSAFSGCSSLTGVVTIPEGITSIADYVFRNCSNLTSILLSESVTSIGESAFSGCSSLTSINIPKSVASLGNYVFSDCTRLTTINIPESVTSIGDAAFSGCSSLSSINIPNRVSRLQNCFAYCSSLTSVIIPNSVTSLPGCFIGCTSLTSIAIPEGVTNLTMCFSGCTGLTSVTIPDSVTSINGCFNNCSSLTRITIPEGVTSIGSRCFYNCSSLTRIDVKPVSPPEGGVDMFYNTGLCPIYIPEGSKEAYLKADYWQKYALRMRVEGNDSPIIYSSIDYSQDGEIIQLQQASIGRGVNIILMGDGFLDKDMIPGGKYEKKMREGMEQFFSYEPYYSFRNRFNVYAVKVVSKNDYYGGGELVNRALSYERGDTLFYRRSLCFDYAKKVQNTFDQPLKIAVLFNTDNQLARSFCLVDLSEGDALSFIMNTELNVINHELGGHGFAFLVDEYEENNGAFTDRTTLDELYSKHGNGANVDWRSNPEEVRWSRFLKDPRYQYEGLGVFEGGYLYAKGIFRSTENSIMRTHYIDTGKSFNAPSREQIYKMIMKYSEGNEWVYDYEEFAKADEHGRMVAAEVLGPWKASASSTRSLSREDNHHPPVFVDDSVKEVGFDKDGNLILIR